MAASLADPSCLIIGVDNHVGAYLARLLEARGLGVAGVGAPVLLARLGIAESVTPVAASDAAVVAAQSRLVFAISDATPARADLIADSLGAAAGRASAPRFIHVADVADLDLPAVRALLPKVSAARGTRRIETANVLLEAHDSRLGPAGSLMARITGAAFAAAQDRGAQAIVEVAESGPRDWGWTPEYVDAVQRLAARPALVDLVVASGHRLTAAEIADHAFAYFKRDAAAYLRIAGSGTSVKPVDPAPVKAATGWSASTHGRDLVRAICEGAGDRG